MTERIRFQWITLVLTVSDDRPQSEVNVAGGVARAAQILRRRRASVVVEAERAVVRFSPAFWSEKWMWGVADGQIAVLDRNGRTAVEVRASIVPVILTGTAAAVLVTGSLPPVPVAARVLAAVLSFAVLAGGNYVFARAGMKSLLRDTLSPPEHWSSFEAGGRLLGQL